MPADVDEHRVHLEVGGVLGQGGQVVGRSEARGLPRLVDQVEDHDDPGVGADEGLGAAPGTSRCGITEVNHEPGPSTTQSASAMASSAAGAAGGSAGTSAIESMTPSVVATSTWPRTLVSASGSSGSSPRTSAVMSIGVSAIGSTRPVAPSSRPT